MITVTDILNLQYTGGMQDDMDKLLAAHHFIMDEHNSIEDRAAVLRDMSIRGLNLPATEVYDHDAVHEYTEEFYRAFLAE